MDMIVTQDLSKTFARGREKVEAVRRISFQVRQGEIFGLLGPNGAGKSTTLRMLATLMPPSSGSASIMGLDLVRQPRQVRQRIGYVSQQGGCYGFATGYENLVLQGRLYGQSRAEARDQADRLVQSLDMADYCGRRVMTYSGGQRRHVELAMGIMHSPSLLFLDEPTTGLDPVSRATFWREINALRDQGMTIFLSTHYMDEADALCDTLCIMDHGRIVARGTSAELKREIGGDIVLLGLEPDDLPRAMALMKDVPEVHCIETTRQALKLCVDTGEKALPVILPLLVEACIPLASIEMKRPSLDEVYLRVTGHAYDSETGEARNGEGNP